MAGRVITPFERSLTTTVNDIEHIESNSYTTFGIVKIFFHPSVNIATANAQVTAISQTLLKQMPPGSTPPLITNYSASTVPIIQLALSGLGLTEQDLADLGLNFLRPRLVTVQGAAIPYPFGGKTPQVMFDLDTAALQSRGLTGLDVANALAAQNLNTPAGTEKIGNYEYTVNLNSAPAKIPELGDLPIKSVRGAMVYMHDVAQVHNGSAVQTNIVHVDGNRSVLLSVFKNGTTSTLDIVSGIKRMLGIVKPSLPDTLEIKPIADQSVFVRASIQGVVREGVIAAALTSLMILLFLGSWRSTLIVTTSIPLSILGAIAALAAIGETLNVMTLGGLALAVGILVDEATVTIESINYHLEQGKAVETAILDGASQIVVPAFVSLLCICIVFIPMFFLSGVSRFLFVPMAESVMFAMVCSFLLSRTLVPTMAKYLLRPHEAHGDVNGNATGQSSSKNPLVRFQHAFEASFVRLRAGYHDLLALAIGHRRAFVACFLGFVAVSFLLAPFLGRNFFPQVDGGQILLHVRAPVGMRIEETAARFADVEKTIRDVIPPSQVGAVVDNIGTYLSSLNTIYNNTGTIGESDGDIQISLQEGHAPTADYVNALRERLPRRFPGMTFSFLPADIVSQILNFGAPAPIDLQVRGNDLGADFAYANKLLAQVRRVPGVADARIQQSAGQPTLDVNIDRTRAQYTGRDRSRRHQQPGRRPGELQPGGTRLLAQREERRHVSDRATDAAISDRHAAGPAESADQRHWRAHYGVGWGRRDPARSQRRGGVAVRHITDGSDLRDDPGARSRRGLGRHPEDHRPERQGQAERRDRRPGRPDGHHEQCLLRPAVRPARGHRAGLFTDRDQLPIVERSLRHHHRVAGGARRHRLDAVCDAHHALGAGAHWRDHVYGRGDRQQRAGNQFRAREAQRAWRRNAGRAGGWICAPTPGVDDGAGDGHRHVAHGVGPGRWR